MKKRISFSQKLELCLQLGTLQTMNREQFYKSKYFLHGPYTDGEADKYFNSGKYFLLFEYNDKKKHDFLTIAQFNNIKNFIENIIFPSI